MQYVRFTQRQDIETLLNCMIHWFHFFAGVTATIPTDNMKTWVVDRIEGQPRFHPRMLDFAKLLRLCAACLPSVPAGDEGQD